MTEAPSGIDLYWLPLGAGGRSVRLNGLVFEAVVAGFQRRKPCDLFHSALAVRAPSGRFVIEMTPVREAAGASRGVVAEGAVGSRLVGRFRPFRYEVHRWRDGSIGDVREAVGSPQRLSADPIRAQHLLELAAEVPAPVWGRDELDAGEMWNSNSVTSWLLARSGVDMSSVHPPVGGRAPGWDAGLVIARRQDIEIATPTSRRSPPENPSRRGLSRAL